MSFSLHQVSLRAGGGEIARARRLDAAQPIIGRGAECDIHLPDLAVDLRHARLSETPSGKVRIEALGSLGFEIAGRFVRQAEVDPGAEPAIIIGPYRLTFRRGSASEVVVSVSRGPEVANAKGRDEKAVFSPNSRMFGRRSLAWTFGLVILFACLAVPAAVFFLGGGHRTIHADQQWTSGPLSKAHAFLQGDCQACHRQAFVAVRDEACLSCHAASRIASAADIGRAGTHAWGGPPPRLVLTHAPGDRLFAATPPPRDAAGRVGLLFAKAFNHPSTRCASCHLEHISADRTAASRPGGPRPLPFLKTVNTCAGCHSALRSRVADTRLRDAPDWAGHPDFRPYVAVGAPGGRVRLARIDLAATPVAYTGLIFSHRLHLLPGGGVAREASELGGARGYGGPLSCASCHRQDVNGRGFRPVTMERDCAACHSLAFARDAGGLRTLPHGSVAKLLAVARSLDGGARGGGAGPPMDGRRRPGVAPTIAWPGVPVASSGSGWGDRLVRASFAPGGACAYCHVVSSPPAGSLAYVVAPVPQVARHLPTGAFDHGLPAHHQDARGQPTCASCHAAKDAEQAGAVLMPSITRCAACHGSSTAARKAASDCVECHRYHDPGRPGAIGPSGAPAANGQALAATLGRAFTRSNHAAMALLSGFSGWPTWPPNTRKQ